MRHMHADLMGATRLQPASNQSGDAEILQRLVMGDGFASARGRHDRHAFTMRRVSTDRRIDNAASPVGSAPHESEIVAHQMQLASMILEEPRQALVRGVGLGDHKKPCGVLVDAMHDAGFFDAANARQGFAAVGYERIDQRPGLVAAGRMHHQTGRLVDDKEMRVLENDIQRNVFALGLSGLGGRNYEGHRFASDETTVGVGDRATRDQSRPLLDQSFYPRAGDMSGRDIGAFGEEPVEPCARLLFRNDKVETCRSFGQSDF